MSSAILGVQCIPQRAALLKSMLNFLKKAIQDPAFSDGIRHGERPQTRLLGDKPPPPRLAPFLFLIDFYLKNKVMDGSLPTSLKHIISNAEYYGPSLFLLGELRPLWQTCWIDYFYIIISLIGGGGIWLFPPLPVLLSALLPPAAATEVVTVFVFQEPSLLSSLQDNGLTDVMLHALLIKDVSFSPSKIPFSSPPPPILYLFFLYIYRRFRPPARF